MNSSVKSCAHPKGTVQMSILELQNVYYTYKSKYQTVQALRGVSCSFDEGSVYAVIGKSGSGKSTMLSLMAGLELPDTGSVLYRGNPTDALDRDRYRRESVAVIYQNFRLFPLMTAAENVMYPMELRGDSAKASLARAKQLILSVGLPDSVFNRWPAMLSGGEQQRVAIARALASEAKLLLADEPTGNLDSASSETVITILRRLAHESGYCVIIVTHDYGILDYTDRIFRMTDGTLSEEKK